MLFITTDNNTTSQDFVTISLRGQQLCKEMITKCVFNSKMYEEVNVYGKSNGKPSCYDYVSSICAQSIRWKTVMSGGILESFNSFLKMHYGTFSWQQECPQSLCRNTVLLKQECFCKDPYVIRELLSFNPLYKVIHYWTHGAIDTLHYKTNQKASQKNPQQAKMQLTANHILSK